MSTPTWLARHLDTPCVFFKREPDGTDEYGNVKYTDVAIPAMCFMQPSAQTDIQDGRADVGDFQMHLDASLAGVIDGFVRVEVGGISYEAVAPPAVYRTFYDSRPHHVEISVNRSTA